MIAKIEGVVLEMLKGLRNDVVILRAEMHDQFRDLKQRMLNVERDLGSMTRDTADP
jgi:hypothetical protein